VNHQEDIRRNRRDKGHSRVMGRSCGKEIIRIRPICSHRSRIFRHLKSAIGIASGSLLVYTLPKQKRAYAGTMSLNRPWDSRGERRLGDTDVLILSPSLMESSRRTQSKLCRVHKRKIVRSSGHRIPTRHRSELGIVAIMPSSA